MIGTTGATGGGPVRAAVGGPKAYGAEQRTAKRFWGIVAVALSLLAASPAFAQPANVQPGIGDREYRDNVPPRAASDIKIPTLDSPRDWQNAQNVRLVLRGVNIEGNTVIDDETLAAPFADLIGRDVSVAQVFAATEQITRLYDEAGYALSLAYVPAQDTRNGIVLIRVIEGYIGEVAIRDSEGHPSERWQSYADALKESRPLRTDVLERTLLLISDLAGVKATNFFERMQNAGPGAMRLVVNVDRKTVGARVELNNRGSQAIGPLRAFVNFELNDVVGLDERFSAYGAGTLDGQELVYVGGRFDLPVWSDGTVIYVEAAHSDTRPGTALLSALEFQGAGWTGSIGITHAIIRSLNENLFASIGMTYKNLRSSLSGSAASHDRMAIATAGLDYDTRDRWGGLWRAAVNVFVGLNILDATQKNDPLSSRAGASGRFVKVEGSVSHLASLSDSVSLFAELAGQVADGPLLVSEQCGYGGGYIGRAFDPFEITGDHCVKARAELRFDIPSGFLRSSQFYVLADFGYLIKAGTLLPTETRTEAAESIGWGWRFKTEQKISGFVELAHPLDRGLSTTGGTRDTRIFFGLAADY